MTITLRPYQQQALTACWDYLRHRDGNPALVLPTGCHAAGARIVMFDGSTKAVESIAVGDVLMGPDSRPRHVLRLARGCEPMYRITPRKGAPFTVNANHILSLRTTNEGKRYPCSATGTELEAISVRDWLGKSASWRHLRKLWRTGVAFPTRARPDLDPWALGALIGDGCIKHGIEFAKPDADVLDALWEEMGRHGLKYNATERNGCWHVSFVRELGTAQENPVTGILRELGLFGLGSGDKFVPDCYKRSDRETRLGVLAGLLDTDGHYDGGGFDYISKSRQLAEDVAFIARSVGLVATLAASEKYCQTGAGGTYWRVHLSGHVDMIPNRCSRKKAAPRKQKKNPMVTGFTVEPVGDGNFYGFMLDGDRLYLTDDFVVHHNSGKSPLMAAIASQAVQEWGGRVAIVAHVQELVEQNSAKLRAFWPEAPMGIYAAGMRRRDRFDPILFCQIQSVYNRAHVFGKFDLLLIDEAHRIPLGGEGRYREFIVGCRRFNPRLRIVGLTATPYRLQGQAVPVCGPEHVLNEVAYEARIADLIGDGYLSQLTSRAGELPDLSAVHLRGGEYIESELAAAMLAGDLVRRTVADILLRSAGRRAGIVFCVDVAHAQAVMDELRAAGEVCALVHGGTPKGERARLIQEFQRGALRWMVNINVLAEGFDAPHIDVVAMLRPTKSPGLYYQQVGRGFRLAPGKTDCLVLDYAGNMLEHGPVDEIRVQTARPKKPAEVQLGKTKECPRCQALLAFAMRICPTCGHEFGSADPAHSDQPVDAPVLASQRERVITVFDVDGVEYSRHKKPGKIPSLRVTYCSGLRRISEWVCIEHAGLARQKAAGWWRARSGGAALPRSIDEALERTSALAAPARIVVDETGKYPEIVRHEFDAAEQGRTGQIDSIHEADLAGTSDPAGTDSVRGVRGIPGRLLRAVEGQRAA